MRRRRALETFAAAALALSGDAAAADSATVRIAGAGSTDPYDVPFYARDGGFFARAGLDVELVPQPTVAAGVQAVAAGAADVSQGDLIMLSNGLIRGLGFTVIAGGGIYRFETSAPSLALAVLKDSPLQRAQELEGKNVGVVTLNSLSAIGMLEWARRSGADPSKIRMVELSFTQMPAALARGDVVAAVAVEPFLSSGQLPLRILASIYNALAPFYLGVWFTTKDWLTNNPATARKLVAAIYDTARWANTHQNETAELVAKYAKYNLDDVKRSTRTEYATSLDPALMDPVLDSAYRFNAISKPLRARDLITRV